MQKITPFFWFDTQAEEAAKFYKSIFPKSKITTVTRYNEAGAKVSGRPKGSAMTVALKLNGQQFTFLNGGPLYSFTQAISFVIECNTQKEVDHYWNKLSAGGKEVQCGWLTDKFGVAWQVVPVQLPKLLGNKNPQKAMYAMQAMIKMKKIIIADLEQPKVRK